MLDSEKDRLAAEAMERWRDFEHGCRPKKKFLIREFRAFGRWQNGTLNRLVRTKRSAEIWPPPCMNSPRCTDGQAMHPKMKRLPTFNDWNV